MDSNALRNSHGIIGRVMEPKGETRVNAELPVRVWGMDADGKPFFQNATASNLSSEGALLSKAVALPKGFDAGVRALANQTIPWAEVTKKGQDIPELTRRSDKRRFLRHRVQFPIAISFADSHRAQMQCCATDIGGRGCYVETLVPLSVATDVIITFWVDSEKISTKGVVRTSDSGVGMGIEFTALEEQIQKRLQEYLDKMDQSFAKAATQTS